jgi:hypothetical protein
MSPVDQGHPRGVGQIIGPSWIENKFVVRDWVRFQSGAPDSPSRRRLGMWLGMVLCKLEYVCVPQQEKEMDCFFVGYYCHKLVVSRCAPLYMRTAPNQPRTTTPKVMPTATTYRGLPPCFPASLLPDQGDMVKQHTPKGRCSGARSSSCGSPLWILDKDL